MAKLNQKSVLVIALILGFITSVLVYVYLKQASQPAGHHHTVGVVVAKQTILPRTVVTQEMVGLVQVPPEFVQPGAMNELTDVVGKVVREQIDNGEQVTERRLLLDKKLAGLTAMIPEGRRALTVGVNDIIGVGGFVKPGDSVDVLVTFDNSVAGISVTSVIVQDILVLAVNSELEGSGDNKNVAKDKVDKGAKYTSTVTLAVTPAEAEKVTLAEEKGKIRLALRPFLPAGYEMTSSVVPFDLTGRTGKIQTEHAPVQQSVQPPATPPIQQPPTRRPDTTPTPSGKTVQVIRGSTVKTTDIPGQGGRI